MPPDRPSVDVPVPIYTLPELPSADVPVLITIIPDTPVPTWLRVWMATAPVLEPLSPPHTCTRPPVESVALVQPPDSITSPPSPVLPLPART